jgi:glyoxylase-like metal-dependent hydrolase (beta-lactamase superfamily II)/rhodanese-related sulfurtransferase
VLLRQFVDDDLGCASYLIADEETLDGLLVDPPYAVEPLLAQAERDGVRLTGVLETHTHADHVSGHGRLALELGLPVRIHPAAEPSFAFEPLEEGELPLGRGSLRVLHTPGHRPEHCCLIAGEAVLTGDSLFVGTAARPDLAIEPREGSEDLFRSLQRLLQLPGDLRVFPGHVAGSLCGVGMSGDPSSTIGAERRTNPVFAFEDAEDFADSWAAVTAPQPANARRIVEVNRGAFVGAPPALRPVEAGDGATVLDVRPLRAFAEGHVPGAINVPVSGSSFGTKAGYLLRPGERVVLHASSAAEAEQAGRRLHAVAFMDLVGYLDSPDATERLETVGVDDLEELIRGGAEVIDVREHDERSEGFVPGTRHIPFRLARACTDSLPADRPVITLCESGARAGIAASVLRAAGVDARPVVDGGVADLQARGKSLVEFRRCGGAL